MGITASGGLRAPEGEKRERARADDDRGGGKRGIARFNDLLSAASPSVTSRYIFMDCASGHAEINYFPSLGARVIRNYRGYALARNRRRERESCVSKTVGELAVLILLILN